MLTRIGNHAHQWATSSTPWTNVYGLARTLLALSTAGTLAANPTIVLFQPAVGIETVPQCGGVRAIGAFCLAPGGNLELVRWLLVGLLLVVASGWRPRVTGLAHWWASASLMMNGVIVDGGDSVAAVLSLLLLPITLTDRRRWHWDAAEPFDGSDLDVARRLTGHVGLSLIRLQVAGIYFHAAAAKFAVEEWSNGTALYYFLIDRIVGAADWLMPLLVPILHNGTTLALLTWGVMVLEFCLAAGLFASKRYRPLLLVAGISLHGGIMLIHGLISFSTAMFAALILFLRSPDQPFAFDYVRTIALRLQALVSPARRAERRLA